MNWLAGGIEKHRTSLTVLVLLVTALAGWGVVRVEYDDDPRKIFERRDDEFDRLEQFYADFGADDNDVVLVIKGARLFDRDVLNAVRQMVRDAANVDGVESVNSIFDLRRAGSTAVPLIPNPDAPAERFALARERALAHPLAVGQMVSADGQTMLAIARLRGNALTTDEMGVVLDRLHRITREASLGNDLTIWLTGHPSVSYDSLALMRGEMIRSLSLITAVSTVLGLLLFRRVAAVVMTITGPTLGVVWVMGLMGWCGEKVNGLNAAIPPIVFAIGFTDAVHLMIDYRHGRRDRRSAVSAASQAIRDLGLPCLLTALTTGVGFGSLILARTNSVQHFGIWCGLGTLMTFVVGIVVFPLLGSWRALGDRSLLHDADDPLDLERHHWLRGVVMPVVRHPKLASLASLALCVVMAPSPFRLQPDLHWDEAIATHSETSLALRECDRAFGGAMMGYVIIEWPETAGLDSPELIESLREVHACIVEHSEFRGPLSLLDLFQVLPGSETDLTDRARALRDLPEKHLRHLVRRDLRRLVVSFHTPDVGAAALVPALQSLADQLEGLERAHPGFRFELTGTVVVAARNLDFMIADLANSLGFEAIAVFLLMVVGFRSVYLGVMSMVPNLFPLLVATSLLVWTGQPLTVTGAIAFNLCLGLAVDDTIHFLLRLDRERRVDNDLCAAVLRTFDAVGTALVTTTPILIGGMATMLFSGIPTIRLFAWLSCATLLAAMIGDLFVLPALLLCFARRTNAQTSDGK